MGPTCGSLATCQWRPRIAHQKVWGNFDKSTHSQTIIIGHSSNLNSSPPTFPISLIDGYRPCSINFKIIVSYNCKKMLNAATIFFYQGCNSFSMTCFTQYYLILNISNYVLPSMPNITLYILYISCFDIISINLFFI